MSRGWINKLYEQRENNDHICCLKLAIERFWFIMSTVKYCGLYDHPKEIKNAIHVPCVCLCFTLCERNRKHYKYLNHTRPEKLHKFLTNYLWAWKTNRNNCGETTNVWVIHSEMQILGKAFKFLLVTSSNLLLSILHYVMFWSSLNNFF